ncbi:MAG: hypothetical protein LBE21_04530 [Pseudomonadales bacterium]|nr:hypothetical protein [Pseudomonadales bacterium]
MTAVKELARHEGVTVGALVSRLLRKALTQPEKAEVLYLQEPRAHYGFRPLAGDNLVSNDQVNALRDEQGI